METHATGPSRWFFDVWSRVYDQAVVQRLTYRPLHDAVLRILGETRPEAVLDLGCGTGLLTTRLWHEAAIPRVFGADFSRGMLFQAVGHAPDVPFVQATALALPLRTASVDAITCTEAFHWFPDQPMALRECRRVLRPGGLLLLALVAPPLESVSDAAHTLSGVVGQPLYWPTRTRMRAMLTEAGLTLEREQRVFRLPAGLLLPPVLFVARREPDRA